MKNLGHGKAGGLKIGEDRNDTVASLEPAKAAQFYAGNGRLLNLVRAHGELAYGNSSGIDHPAEAKLLEAGWSKTKSGGYIEPGQSDRAVDTAYTNTLEHFTTPRVETQNFFDSRNSEGEFEVYTMGQAVDLLRRGRRDAVGIQEMFKGQVSSLSVENIRLENDLKAQINKVIQTEDAFNVEKGKLKIELSESDREREALGKEKEKIKAAADAIAEALGQKAGFLGGDRALRAAIEAVLANLRTE